MTKEEAINLFNKKYHSTWEEKKELLIPSCKIRNYISINDKEIIIDYEKKHNDIDIPSGCCKDISFFDNLLKILKYFYLGGKK